MPTILLKKSDTPGSVPGTANLTNLAGGVEVAVNTADKRVYSMTSASAVIELGTNPSSLTCADVSATVFRSASATITNLIATSASITTLTNNPTFGAGTANGVLYLNGSKVATSGSALTFDGTDFKMPNGGSMLLGASASGASLLLINGTAAAQRLVLGTSGTDAVINATRTSGTSPNLLFQLEGANSMALTSTGLGIGTASPGAKLHVLGSNFVGIFAGTNANTVYTEYRYNSTTTSGLIGNGSSLLSAAADSDFIVRSEGALKFATNGNNFRAVIDSSGNLGLGVTPSAWTSQYSALQFGASASLATYKTSSDELFLQANAFENTSGNWTYIASLAASQYWQSAGKHIWRTAASGTAGNTISFTQAMTLDASGRLLVGDTTPRTVLNKTIELSSAGTSANQCSIFVNQYVAAGNAVNTGYLTFQRSGSGTLGTNSIVASGDRLGMVRFSGANGTDYNSAAEIYAEVDGTPGASSDMPGRLVFATTSDGAGGTTERARITAGGYFKASNAGTYVSSTGVYHELVSDSNGTSTALITHRSGTDPVGLRVYYNSASPIGTGNLFLNCDDNAGVRATIRSNGGIANYSANDVNLSDERTKKDIAPLGSMWDKFKAIKIVTFKYKDQTHDDDNIGVIAQQVESVAPEFVDADGFGETPEDGVPLKTVYTTDMYHAAIKALQEAMARIEQLEADMAALKASA
jgi:hypothetical protein